MADTPAVRTSRPPTTMREAYEQLPEILARMLPPEISPQQFMGLVVSCMAKTPQLRKCEPESFVLAVREAAELRLWPGTNPASLAYLVPVKDHGVWKVSFRIGYRGLEELAFNKGLILTGKAVHKGDIFKPTFGTKPEIEHRIRRAQPNTGAELTYAYAYAKHIRTGTLIDIEVLDRVEVERRRHLGNAPNGNWWTNHPEVMWVKTARRALGMRLPLAPSGQTLQARGVAVVDDEDRFSALALPDGLEDEDGPSAPASGAESLQPADPPDDDQPPGADERQSGDGQEPKQGQLV